MKNQFFVTMVSLPLLVMAAMMMLLAACTAAPTPVATEAPATAAESQPQAAEPAVETNPAEQPADVKPASPTEPAEEAWIPATPLPVPMAGGIVKCAETPGRFYFLSAIMHEGVNGSYMYRYDIVHDSWVKLKNKPVAERGAGVVCYEGKIYVAGGTDLETTFNTLYIYDIASNKWGEGPALPEPVFAPGLAAYDGKLYLVGGSRDYPVGRVDILDLTTGVWTAGAPMPHPASGFGYAQVGQYFYAVGGVGDAGNINYTQRYIFTTNKWEAYPNFTARLAYGKLVITESHLYYMGGDIEDGDWVFHSTDELLNYNLNAWPDGAWVDTGTPLPAPNLVPAGICTETLTGGEIWLVGGGIDAYNLFTEVYYLPVGEGCP